MIIERKKTMLKIEKTDVLGWEAAIRGMRNPMNSWDKSDSYECHSTGGCHCERENYNHDGDFCHNINLGDNDYSLMQKLRNAGTDHRKFMRMITVYVDITAPLYWWKEFDTYKVGTVANSCSTMHKIHSKEFTADDFSCEHLIGKKGIWSIEVCDMYTEVNGDVWWGSALLNHTINILNFYREKFLETNDKKYWWQMIQLLPTSYNQKRTIMLNYEVLANMYHSRKNHKLDEWHTFCDWVKTLPYSELITGEEV
jgi:hypothetical protein